MTAPTKDVLAYLRISRDCRPPLTLKEDGLDPGNDATTYGLELKSFHVGLEATSKGKRLQPLIVTKQVDQLSTWLMARLKAGTELSGSLDVLTFHDRPSRGSSDEYLYYRWTGVVQAITWDGSGVDDVVEEHVRIDCSSLAVTYWARGADGKRVATPLRETFKE